MTDLTPANPTSPSLDEVRAAHEKARQIERDAEPLIAQIVAAFARYDTPERPLSSLLATVALGLRNLPHGWEISSHISGSAHVDAWNAAYWNWEVKDATHDSVVLLFDRAVAERLLIAPLEESDAEVSS